MAKTLISPKQFFFFNRRYLFLKILFNSIFILLFLRIVFLQIIEGQKYNDLALNNQEQYIPIQTYRGEIYGRDFDPTSQTNKPLVSNEETLGVYILPVHLKKEEVKKTLYDLAFILNYDFNETYARFQNRANYYEPFLVKENVPVEDIAYLGEKIQDYPGIYWEPIYYRKYLKKSFASHVIGFVSKINKNELTQYGNDPNYHLNSIIGKVGIEKYYDEYLRGKDGQLIRIVDAKNRIRKSFVMKKPEPGYNLVLTIDNRIQDIAEKVMEGEKGAAIVLDPYSGEILAMVSVPNFDPNIFINKPDMKKICQLNADPLKPFLNRAIQAKYPPGSVFKIVTSTAGLQEEVIKPTDTYYCKGYYKFENDDRVFHCTGFHGLMNFYTGLELSCNVYFFNLSYYLGSKKILEHARFYGYGQKSGIDLPGEIEGFLPSYKWKKKVFGENWYDGDTINLGIGQGFILASVMQIADMMAGVANDGLIYRPHLLKAVYSAVDGTLINQTEKKLIHNIPISDENLNILRRGLNLVTIGGTAHEAGMFSRVSFAGKTSTAQNIFGEPHAWFCCYAPYNTKEDRIVVAVFVENGGGGGEVAAPLAVAMINAIFKNVDPKEEKRKLRAYHSQRQYEKLQQKLMDEKQMEKSLDKTGIQF